MASIGRQMYRHLKKVLKYLVGLKYYPASGATVRYRMLSEPTSGRWWRILFKRHPRSNFIKIKAFSEAGYDIKREINESYQVL